MREFKYVFVANARCLGLGGVGFAGEPKESSVRLRELIVSSKEMRIGGKLSQLVGVLQSK